METQFTDHSAVASTLPQSKCMLKALIFKFVGAWWDTNFLQKCSVTAVHATTIKTGSNINIRKLFFLHMILRHCLNVNKEYIKQNSSPGWTALVDLGFLTVEVPRSQTHHAR